MTDYVYKVTSPQVFTALAQTTGFWDPTNNSPVREGILRDGGDFFLNHVGPIEGQDGEWGKLRLNGASDFVGMVNGASGLTIYAFSTTLEAWTSDGVTPAPEWIGSVGLIA